MTIRSRFLVDSTPLQESVEFGWLISGLGFAGLAGNSPSSPLCVGAVASATSVPFSVVSGGLACVVGALIIARKIPELDAYVDEHAAQY